MENKKLKSTEFTINSLQNLLYYRLKDAHNSEERFQKSLSSFREHLVEDKAKELLNEMEVSALRRMKEMEEDLSHIKKELSQVSCHVVQGILKEAEEVIKLSKPSSILDVGILSSLRLFLGYQQGAYKNLLSFLSMIAKLSPMKKRIKNNLDSIEKEEKKLLKLLEGSFLQPGIENQAYEESPIVT